mgnify:CR=1 FL=1
MAISKIDSDGIVSGGITADSLNVGQIGGRRNMVLNGAMQVAQRGTSVTGVNTNGYRTVDRWTTNMNSGGGTWTVTQESSGGVSGFPYSTKIECTTATAGTLSSNEKARWEYRNEGQDLQLLKWGTSDAEAITISFWVKSNKTGTYTLEINNSDGTSTNHICKQYTIDAADTWEYKTLTCVGDTGVSTKNDNTTGIQMFFHLVAGTDFTSGTLATSWATSDSTNRAVGNVNLGDTIGNYWQITGVQLEVGSVATPFEHRSFGEELALCQRYFCKSYNYEISPGASLSVDNLEGANATSGGTTGTNRPFWTGGPFPVTMRDAPTVTLYNVDGTTGKISGGSFAKRDGTAVNIGQRNFNVYNNGGATADEDHYCIFTAQSEL